jgi:hypothetical protein
VEEAPHHEIIGTISLKIIVDRLHHLISWWLRVLLEQVLVLLQALPEPEPQQASPPLSLLALVLPWLCTRSP